MRWYQAIDSDNAVDDPFVADQVELGGLDEWDFASGRYVDGTADKLVVRASKAENDGTSDDVLQTAIGFVPIVSERTRRALLKAGIGGIQYLPVRVVRPSGQEIRGYSIANILNVVDGLDTELSKLRRFGPDYFVASRRGEVQSVEEPVLRAEALRSHDIVRVTDYPVSVFVSDRFRRIFEENDLTGYSFSEVRMSGGDQPSG